MIFYDEMIGKYITLVFSMLIKGRLPKRTRWVWDGAILFNSVTLLKSVVYWLRSYFKWSFKSVA